MEELMFKKFRDAMKSLNEKDMEVVSNNLHKNNVRIERDIQFSQTRPKYTKLRLG